MSQPSTPPAAQASPLGAARRWLVLVIVSLAFFMVELDITVANVALPSMETDLGFSGTELHWVIDAYLLGFGGFLLLAGRGADLLGRKPMFLAGTATFALGSAITAIAGSPTAVILGRGLQGLGGAMLTPTGLSTLTTSFTEPRERTRALGVWTFIQTGSVALGLTLGGMLAELSWRWIFLINLPVAALVLLAAPGLLPPTPRTTADRRGFDLAGTIAITAGPALLVYALANAPTWGWASMRTLGFLAAAAVILVGLVIIESRSRNPLIRLGVFRIRSLSIGNASFFLASSGLFGMFYFSSLYVQQVLGYRPLTAGLALLPLAAGVLGGVAVAQRLLPRQGVRWVGAGGLAVGALGTGLLTQITATSPYVWPFLPGLFVLAFGLGLAMVALTLLATSVGEQDAGLASGLFTAVSYIGGALGLAVLATIATTRTTNTLATAPDAQLAALVSGFQAAYLTAAFLVAAAAALLVLGLRRRHLPAHTAAPATTAGK